MKHAKGGWKVAIFGREDLDPLYFDVSKFLAPPDTPYMPRNAEICNFSTFWESHLKHAPKVGVCRENLLREGTQIKTFF